MSVNPKSQLEKRVDALEAKPSGGGVGEAVGKYSEIFNGYNTEQTSAVSIKRNVIDDGTRNDRYGGNHAEGSGHNITRSYMSRATGEDNKLDDSECGSVGGYYNDVAGLKNSYVYGNNIYLKTRGNHDTTNGSLIIGESIQNYKNSSDTAAEIKRSSIIGEVIRVLGSIQDSLLIGNSIDVTTAQNSIILGQGHNQITNALECIVCGHGADVSSTSLKIVVGDGMSDTPENVFTVDSVGLVTAYRYNTNSADYADLFEWLDGNPDNEDRRGMLVSFAGDKIIPAHGNDIDGVISNSPSVCGNDYQYWHGKYETDVYGRPLNDEAGKLIISEKYDRKKRYVPRSERPEWAPVGMCGRLVVNDDGSCIPGSYVSARYGIGTKCLSPTRVKMLKRIDEKHIEVVVRG